MTTFNYLPFGYKKNENFKNFNSNPISFLSDGIYIRSIRYFDIEITKLISFLVRDKNWNNYDPVILNEDIITNKNSINLKFELSYSDNIQKFLTTNTYIISNESIKVISEGKFITDFETNRIGYNLLLPLKDVVGQKLSIKDDNKNIIESTFPEIINPEQPFINISEINYLMKDSLNLKFLFKGIKFEMEDQRNWGDASFKIYSGSLLNPFPYIIKKDTSFYQEIEIIFNEVKPMGKTNKINPDLIVINNTDNKKGPKVGIKIDNLNFLNNKVTKELDFDYILSEFDLTNSNIKDFNIKNLTKETNLFSIFLIDHKISIEETIDKIREILSNIDCNLSYILISPKVYLNSYQPSGPWPEVPLLSDYNKRLIKYFPKSKIVSGMVTNFTELNRKKPIGDYDMMSFSFTPIVHDASDHGIMETPETIDYIMKSVKNINAECDIHIGPICLGMHHNPYGESLAKNLKRIRTEMTNQDLRHDSLFSLVWSVGMYQQLSKYNINMLTFNSLEGYHGIYSKNLKERPLYLFNKVIVEFADKKICTLNHDLNFFSICSKDNNIYKVLISNKTKKKRNLLIQKYTSIKSNHINEKNFNNIIEDINSFFKLKDIDNNLEFLPYESKYIEIIK